MKKILALLFLTTLAVNDSEAQDILPAGPDPEACLLKERAPSHPTSGPRESWVRARVELGRSADLSQFPNPEDRRLRASFVRELIAEPPGDEETRGHKITIEGAIIEGELSLTNLEIPDALSIRHSTFIDPVHLTDARFSRALDLRGSRFEKEAQFASMRVASHSTMSMARFHGHVNFMGAKVERDLRAEATTFCDRVNFGEIRVGGTVKLGEAEFWGSVLFTSASIGSDLDLRTAKLMSTESAFFDAIRVDGDLILEKAQLLGATRFDDSVIGGDLEAFGAEFSLEHEARFRGMSATDVDFVEAEFGAVDLANVRLTSGLDIRDAKFNDTAAFTAGSVGTNFRAEDAQFTNSNKRAAFNEIRVGGDLSLDGAVFKGKTIFDRAVVAGSMKAREAHFEGGTRFANAEATEMSLEGAEFGGRADFTGSRVASNFDIQRATFSGPAIFKRSRVDGDLRAGYATFHGGVDLTAVEASNVHFYFSSFCAQTPEEGPCVRGADQPKPERRRRVDLSGLLVRKVAKFSHTTFALPVLFDKGTRVGADLILDSSEFHDEARFNGSVVKGALQGSKSKFRNRASFTGVELGQVNFNGAEFETVDFTDARVASTMDIQGATFVRARLMRLHIAGELKARRAVFGSIDMTAAEAASVQFREAKFGFFDESKGSTDACRDRPAGPTGATGGAARSACGARFPGMVVRKAASFSEAEFRRSLDLGRAKIGGSLILTGSTFPERVLLTDVRVGGNLALDGSTFEQGLILNDAIIARDLTGVGSTFKKQANFIGMQAREAKFEPQPGPTKTPKITSFERVSFNGSRLASSMRVGKATFEEAQLSQVWIGGDFHAKGTRFGRIDMNGTEASNLYFHGTHFGNQAEGCEAQQTKPEGSVPQEAGPVRRTPPANLSGVVARNAASFTDATFGLCLDLSGSRISELSFKGRSKAPLAIPELDLTRAQIAGQWKVEHATVDRLSADSIRVDRADFWGFRVKNELTLQHSRFGILKFDEEFWPQLPATATKQERADAMSLVGMTYGSIDAGPHANEESAEPGPILALQLIEDAAFNASTYAELEGFFAGSGRRELANEVYIAQKERERREILIGLASYWNTAMSWLVDHGRSPHLAFAWSAPFIFVGFLIFYDPNGMRSKGGDEDGVYSCVWYSLDLFLPFIDLQAVSAWEPVESRKLAMVYMRIHTIAGWFLIPVGLASVTGVIK